METKLSIRIIGSISIEQYESGKEEFETNFCHGAARPPEEGDSLDPDSNTERLF